MRTPLFFLLSCVLLGFGPVSTLAASFDASLTSDDISLAKGQFPTERQPIRLYATLTNAGTEDIEGLVRFFEDDRFIGGKVFSLRSGTRPEDAWVLWTPSSPGEHLIRVEIVNDAEFPDATPANNQASTAFVVHQDLDKDGLGDEHDPDIDGDSISNTEETRLGTNYRKTDTDEDGTPDNEDAYPLDPTRQRLVVVPPPQPIVVPPAAPAVKAPTQPVTPKTAPTPIVTKTAASPSVPAQEPVQPTINTTTTTESVAEVEVPPAPTPVPAPEPVTIAQPTTTPETQTTPWGLIAAGVTSAIGLGALLFSFISAPR
jgi:hypothetical protein